MLILALDTATAATAVVVGELDSGGFHARSARQHVDARAHGELLAPQIDAALAEAGARPSGLAAIVAGTGPGPFTGLRIGLATAAAMGQALDLPTYGVCSLDGIGAATVGVALVATDARRREIYWAVYSGGARVTEPAVDRPAEVAAPRAERAYGEGALRYRDVLGLPVSEAPLYPDPALLAAAAADRIRAGGPGEQLVPRYLRRPDTAEPAAARPPLPGAGADRPRSGPPASPDGGAGAAVTAPAMKLDRLCARDIDEVLLIEQELFGPERWTAGMFRSELDQGYYYLAARDDDGRVLGYAGLAVTTPDEAWVNNIAVRRDAQRHGIGRALLEALLAEAARRTVDRVLLEVAADNAPAQRLYARYGFETIAVRRGYYQPSNTDALVMLRE